jgi:hypothetical protein
MVVGRRRCKRLVVRSPTSSPQIQSTEYLQVGSNNTEDGVPAQVGKYNHGGCAAVANRKSQSRKSATANGERNPRP